MRTTDNKKQEFKRSSRFTLINGQWYFKTREGDTLGPYPTIEETADAVEFYIALMELHESGQQLDVA